MPYYDLNDPSGISFLDDATVSHGFTIGLNGVWGKVRDVVVTFTGLTHTFPADLDFVLLGPGGTNLEFWSDVGAGIDVTNANFTIGDFGVFAPEHTALSSGSIYRPTDYGAVETATNWDGHVPSGTVINHPGPIIGSATFASAFGGASVDHSSWRLAVKDDSASDIGSLASWSLHINYNLIVKPDDFDANHISDILWQRSDGTAGMWVMSGTNALSIGAVGPFNPGASWQIKANGDFNADETSDILWQNSDGTPAIWLMDGRNVLSLGAVGPFNPGPDWQIKATGDFNFDTKADILWQNSDGTPDIWLMDGTNVVSLGAVGPFNPGPDWQIKATGDFNNDGHSDILWQNVSDGTPAIWLMNGMNVISLGVAGSFNPGAGWQIKGTGDFNDDGMADILWQGSDGTAAIWLMNGMNAVAVGAVGPFNPGPSWHVMGTGDYNADGKSDILWQADDGTPAIWFMDGLNFISGSVAGSFNPGHDWHVIA